MTDHRSLDPFYHRRGWPQPTILAIAWTAVVVTILLVLRLTTGQ